MSPDPHFLLSFKGNYYLLAEIAKENLIICRIYNVISNNQYLYTAVSSGGFQKDEHYKILITTVFLLPHF